MPDNTPVVALSVRPGGKVPVELHVNVPVPPVCVKVWFTAVPTVILDNVTGLTVIVGQLTAKLVKVREPEQGPFPVAVIVKV